MSSAKRLLGLACAVWACLCMPAARADDQPDSGKPASRERAIRSAAPYLNRSTGPQAPERGAPRADNDAGARAGGDKPDNDDGLYDARSLYGGEDMAGEDGDRAEFRTLRAWLRTHAFAAYGGAGLDYVMAQYPASYDSNVAWQFFGGMRMRYVGAELDGHTLGYYRALVNGQAVEVGTDMVSLSLMGFVPLADDTDFYMRAGRTAWSANVNGAGAGPASAVTYGTNGTIGAGIELRHGPWLLRMEARRFSHVYQSDAYTSFGISVGGYFR